MRAQQHLNPMPQRLVSPARLVKVRRPLAGRVVLDCRQEQGPDLLRIGVHRLALLVRLQ